MQEPYNREILSAKTLLAEVHGRMKLCAEHARGGAKPDFDMQRAIKNIALDIVEMAEEIRVKEIDNE